MMVNDLSTLQLESALAYLYSPYQGQLPKILESLTEVQWIAVEMLATQIQEDRAIQSLH